MAKKAGGRQLRRGRPAQSGVPARLRGLGPVRFARDALGELQRAHWPTREQTVRLTVIVLGVCIALAAFLGLFDFALTRLSELMFK